MNENTCHNCELNETETHYFFKDKRNQDLETIGKLCEDCWTITYESGESDDNDN